MKKFKRIILGLSLALAAGAIFGILVPGSSSAAIQGFNDKQIRGASKFSFGNAGSTITGFINGTQVNFTNGPAFLQYTPQQLQGFVNSSNPSPNPWRWYVSPSDFFCHPPRPSQYANEVLVYPNNIKLNAAKTTVVSAQGYLVAYAGSTDAACALTPSGSAFGAGYGTNGVPLTISASSASSPPSGAVITQNSVNTAVYKFGSNGSVITGTYTMANGSTTQVTFTDPQPYDQDWNFAATSASSSPTGNTLPFCTTSKISTPNITLVDTSSSKNNSVTRASKTIPIKSVALPVVTSSANTCAPASTPPGSAKGLSVDNSDLNAEKIFQWYGNSLQSFGSKKVLNLNVDNNTGQNSILYDDSTSCGGGSGWVVLLDSAQGNSGKLFHLTSASSGKVVNGYYNGCKADQGTPFLITIAGTYSSTPAPPPGTSGSACENNANGFSFAWAVCPVLDAASSLTTVLVNLFEGQLSFSVSQLGSSTNPASGNFEVQQSWALMRDISAAFLVIIMLAMVFSQAASFGPFDAYTIKKLLPRLVAAIILIQISWTLFAWVVNLVNAVARGLADLMYYPFGGTSQMDLWHLLNHAHLSTGLLAGMDWAALAVAVTLTVAFVFTMLGFAITAIIALFFAVATLVFRKILIILLLIFSPIALLAWILPGTDRYWKYWRDNFMKALAMFPIAVAIIAAGRIFASVVGTQNNGQFLNLIFIMVGFFGPLFILPKTFKWGGQIMQMAGKNLESVGQRFGKKQAEVWKGYQERYAGKAGNRYNPSAGVFSRTFRRVQSGHMLPTERSRRLTLAAGDKWASDRNDEANALANRVYEKAVANGYKDINGKDLTGVEAGKQALIDLAGQDTTNMFGREKDVSERAARAANKMLIDTKSWPDMQKQQVTKGKNKGKRAFEMRPFRTALITSPQHYAALQTSRPDMAADVIDKAENTTGYKYEDVAAGSAEWEALETERIAEALRRLTPEKLRQAHYGLFDDIGIHGAQMVTDPTTGAPISLSELFGRRLDDFYKAPGTEGKNAVASLRGGEQSHVDAALAHSGRSLLGTYR